MNKKLLMYGGGAVALLAVGAFVLTRSSGSGEVASSDSGSYYPPLVYGGGGSYSGDVATDGSGASSDNSIAAVLANQLATANIQSNLTMAQISATKDISLAGYANDLAITKEQSNASIGVALASQLGNVVSSMVSSWDQGSSSSSSSDYSSSSDTSSIGVATVNNGAKSGLFSSSGASGAQVTNTNMNVQNAAGSNSQQSSSYSSGVQGIGGVKGSLGYSNGVISVDLSRLS